MGWAWIILLPVLVGIPLVTLVNAAIDAQRRRDVLRWDRLKQSLGDDEELL